MGDLENMGEVEKSSASGQPDVAGGVAYGTMSAPHLGDCNSILQAAPGLILVAKGDYSNVTPWITKLFFAHSYFVYIYVFYMCVFAFYKGYTLEYASERRWREMTLIMVIPLFQHMRFYFGFWGCQLGLAYDLCAFTFLNAAVMSLLMYFLFFQAYIFPLDSDYLTVAICLVMVESLCGIANMLQAMTRRSTICTKMLIFTSIVAVLCAIGAFFFLEIHGHQVLSETHLAGHAA